MLACFACFIMKNEQASIFSIAIDNCVPDICNVVNKQKSGMSA